MWNLLATFSSFSYFSILDDFVWVNKATAKIENKAH
jgi:hypothetical protein